jgi:hypothetical protein
MITFKFVASCDTSLHPALGLAIADGNYSMALPDAPASINIPGVGRLEQVAPEEAPHDPRAYPPVARPAGHVAPGLPARLETLALDALPDAPVTPTDADHPALSRLVSEYHSRALSPAQKPGRFKASTVVTYDRSGRRTDLAKKNTLPDGIAYPADAILQHNVELAVRVLGLPLATAMKLTGASADMCSNVASRGFASPERRDEILSAYVEEQRAAARTAAANTKRVERTDYDLKSEGLFILRVAGTRPSDTSLFGGNGPYHVCRDYLFDRAGWPLVDGDEIAFGVTIHTSGTYSMTREERAAIKDPDADLADLLRQTRDTFDNGFAEPGDFPFTGVSVAQRWAVECFAKHAYRLVRSPHSPSHALGQYVHRLLLTLPMAYYPHVDFDAAVALVEKALREYASVRAPKTIQYSKSGARSVRAPDAIDPSYWPIGLIRPEQVHGLMRRELAAGSPWVAGECLTEPSPDDARRLRAELDPAIVEKAIADATQGKSEVKYEDVVQTLHEQHLIGQNTSIAERQRITSTLESLGFKSGSHRVGSSSVRVWRRKAPPPPPIMFADLGDGRGFPMGDSVTNTRYAMADSSVREVAQ